MSKKKQTDSNGQPISPSIRRKSFHVADLVSVRPQSHAQKILFENWSDDKSFFLHGAAGSGKSFLALYLSLHDLLDKETPYKKMYIIRSTVPTRDLGFLPGDLEEKIAVYEAPYMQIFDSLFPYKKSYENMKAKDLIEFLPTAFLRGTTFDDAIIVVDEAQNMTFSEIDTIMTRIGVNSKVIFCGDSAQTDTIAKKDNGFHAFLNIVNKMKKYFSTIRFTHDDVVRSGMVKEYLKTKEKINK